jgi:hypothetical protein
LKWLRFGLEVAEGWILETKSVAFNGRRLKWLKRRRGRRDGKAVDENRRCKLLGVRSYEFD